MHKSIKYWIYFCAKVFILQSRAIMKTSPIHFIFFVVAITSALFSCKREPAVDFKRTDNNVIIRLEADPDRLNPLLSTSAYGRVVYEQIFSYLVVQDQATLEFIPQLVQSLPTREERGDSLIAFTYEIRKEAKWDDGSSITANDFVFSLKAALNPKVPAQRLRPYLAFIKELTVDSGNPKRFTVVSEKYILAEEAIGAAVPVMQESHYDKSGLLREIPLQDFLNAEKIAALAESDSRLTQFAEAFSAELYSRESAGVTGSGPYKLITWETGQRIALERKKDWWGDNVSGKAPALAAYPDQINFKIIADAVAALSALKAEEIDAASSIDPKDFKDLANTPLVSERYNLFSPPALANFFIYTNTTNPKLSDKRVRRALAYAMNPNEIIENIFYGYGQPVNGPVHPSTPYYHKELKPITQDIAKAKALLEEAGWSDSDNNGFVDKEINGKREELALSYLMTANREISKNVGILVQDNAKKAGIRIDLVAKEPTLILDDIKKRNYELAAGGRSLSNTFWDPKQNWHTLGDNRTGFGNAETDALIDEIRVTLEPAARTRKYKKLQEIIYDEQPEIYLFAPQDRVAIHKRFEAVPSSIYPGYAANTLRLKK